MNITDYQTKEEIYSLLRYRLSRGMSLTNAIADLDITYSQAEYWCNKEGLNHQSHRFFICQYCDKEFKTRHYEAKFCSHSHEMKWRWKYDT